MRSKTCGDEWAAQRGAGEDIQVLPEQDCGSQPFQGLFRRKVYGVTLQNPPVRVCGRVWGELKLEALSGGGEVPC